MSDAVLDRAPLPEKLPGYQEFQARTVIRDLIEEYGELKAELILSVLLADERTRIKQ